MPTEGNFVLPFRVGLSKGRWLALLQRVAVLPLLASAKQGKCDACESHQAESSCERAEDHFRSVHGVLGIVFSLRQRPYDQVYQLDDQVNRADTKPYSHGNESRQDYTRKSPCSLWTH